MIEFFLSLIRLDLNEIQLLLSIIEFYLRQNAFDLREIKLDLSKIEFLLSVIQSEFDLRLILFYLNQTL